MNSHQSMTVSLVIPVFNQIHFTKICLTSLLSDLDRPRYEIIVIDNGSSDGTREFLEAERCRLATEVERHGTGDVLRVIANAENRGVAPAWNQGLRAAAHEWIAVLNNDIEVSRGWCRALIWAAEYHRLTLVSPFAQHGKKNYDLEARAAAFTIRNRKRLWLDYDFCAVLFKKSLLDRLGYFDEKYLVGGYEDTDYCYRLRAAGLRYGIAGASYIHHFGSQTLGEFKRRGDQHVAHNKKHFMDKWGEDPSVPAAMFGARLKRSWRRFKMSLGYM